MGILDQLLAGIDSSKQTVSRNISDMFSDPKGYAQKVTDHLRNSNANVVPTAAGGELTNRPMTQDEITEKYVGMTDPGKGVGGGVVGSIKNQPFLRSMFERDSLMRQELKSGRHPEDIMREFGLEDSGFMGTPKNVGIRYETQRPLFDKGVVHYDAAGGGQAMETAGIAHIGPRGGEITAKALRDRMNASQLRIGDFKNIPEESVVYTPYDRWLGEYGSKKRPILQPGQHEFYVNEVEGFPPPYPGEMPSPKVRDILNDPDLRAEYNLSLAAPADSKFHMLARILRDAK